LIISFLVVKNIVAFMFFGSSNIFVECHRRWQI